MIVLEELGTCTLARGAKYICEIAGGGRYHRCLSYYCSTPGASAQNVMHGVKDAGMMPEDIDYI
jgi:3-oxoacyl-(acyl-carrier-protein) synthase